MIAAMFGFSWSEILIIGVAALVVIGPNDLPRAMKTAARWMSAGRKLAREFQSHVDDLVREAELDELREQARKLATQPLSSHLEAMVDPNREIAKAVAEAQTLPNLMTGPNIMTADSPSMTPVQAAEPEIEPAATEASGVMTELEQLPAQAATTP